MQLINVRFQATSNFKEVAAQAATLDKQLARMQGENISLTDPRAIKHVNAASEAMRKAMAATKAWNIENMTLKSGTSALTESLIKNEMTFKQAIQNRRGLSKVMAEQVALQKAMFVETSRAGQAVKGTLYWPNGANSLLNGTVQLTHKLGMLGNVLASGSEMMIKWGKNTQWAGRQLMVGMTLPIVAFGALASSVFYKFDQDFTRIVKVYDFGAGSMMEQTKALKESAISLSREVASAYGRSAQDTMNVMAELAAQGLKAEELVEATRQTMRISTLGDIPIDQALKGRMSLANAFKLDVDEVTEAMEYLNMVENQTVLDLNDVFEALPRAAGPLNQLGGNVEDMSVLLVAMKERGIEAGEGANAIKSGMTRLLNPTRQVKEMMGQYGISVADIVRSTDGELLPTLEMLAGEMQGLDELSKQQIISKLFGTYQYARISAMLDGLVTKSAQVQRAYDIKDLSPAQRAYVAEQEALRKSQSLSGQFNSMIEQLKLSLAGFGEKFLKAIVTIGDAITNLFDFFAKMPSAVKTFFAIGLAISAIVGPVIMLIGLMGNFIGNIAKGVGNMLKLTNAMKLTTAEGLAQRLMLDETSVAYKRMEVSIQGVVAQLANLTRASAEATFMQQTGLMPSQVRESKSGGTKVAYVSDPQHPQYGQKLTADQRAQYLAMKATNEEAHKLTQNTQNAAAATDKAKISAKALTANVAGAAGMMLLLFGHSNNLALAIGGALTVASMFPGAIVGAIKSVGKFIVSVKFLEKAWKAAHAWALAHSAMLKGAAVGIGAVAVAGFVAWNMYKNALEAARKRQEELGQSTQKFAEQLGFVYAKYSANVNAAGEEIMNVEQQTMKLIEMQPELAAALSRAYNSGVDGAEGYANAAALAGRQAMQALYHGADVNEAMQVGVLSIRASGATDQEVDKFTNDLVKKISASVDKNGNAILGTTGSLLSAMILDGMQAEVDQESARVGAGLWERFVDGWMDSAGTLGLAGGLRYVINPEVHIGEDQKQKWKEDAKELANVLSEATEDEAAIIKSDIVNRFEKSLAEAEASGDPTKVKAAVEAQKAYVEQLIITYNLQGKIGKDASIEDVLFLIETRTVSAADGLVNYNSRLSAMGVNSKTATKSQKDLATQLFMNETGIKDVALATAYLEGKISDLNSMTESQIAVFSEAVSTLQEYSDVFKSLSQSSVNTLLSEAARIADEAYEDRKAAAEERFKGIEKELDQAERAAKNAFDKYSEGLEDALDERIDAEKDAWDDRADALRDALEDEKDALEDKYDAQEKAIEDAAEAEIDAIDATIEAEEKAEDLRQKAFEAEKKRIQELARLRNANIDIDAALASGDVDEAARLANNLTADSQVAALEEESERSKEESDQRRDALDKKKEEIEESKQAQLDALEITKQAELDALEIVQKAKQDAFDAERERAMQALERQKEDLAARLQNERQALDDQWVQTREYASNAQAVYMRELDDQQAAWKRKLDQDLLDLQAWVPSSKEEYDKWEAELLRLYKEHGIDIVAMHPGWAAEAGETWRDNMNRSLTILEDKQRWIDFGFNVASAMSEGMFELDLNGLVKWLTNPGAAQPRGVTSPTYASAAAAGKSPVRGPNVYPHTGGLMGYGAGQGFSSRAGRGRSAGLFKDEIPTVLQRGEYVINKSQTRQHLDVLQAINSGKFYHTGGQVGSAKNAKVTAKGAPFAMLGATAATLGLTLMNRLTQNVIRVANERGQYYDNSRMPGLKQSAPQLPVFADPGASVGPVSEAAREAIAEALATSRNVVGMCLQVVRGWWDVGAKYGSASEAWRNAKTKYATGTPPAGAPVWWTGGSKGFGHVALSLGNGNVRSTDAGGPGVTSTVSIASINRWKRLNYGGWTKEINDVAIPLLNGGNIKYDNTLANLHKDEVVLTAPLTRGLYEGIDKLQSGSFGDIIIQNHFEAGVDEAMVERATIKAMKKVEQKRGRSRSIR